MMDRKHCEGCRDDYYNKTPMGLNIVDGKPQCWSLPTAELVQRKKVPLSQMPPWTQGPITVPKCYRQQGFVFVSPDAKY